MGELVELRAPGIVPETPSSSNLRSSGTIVLTVAQARAAGQAIRHLDAVMKRARNVAAMARIIIIASGGEEAACLKAARRVGLFLSTGRVG